MDAGSHHDSTEADKEKDANHPDNKKLEKFEMSEDAGGLAPRHGIAGCTDLLALIMFGSAMFVMTVLGLNAGKTANIPALVNPTDYKGRVCGVDNGVVNKPYGYVIDQGLNLVCTKKCPKYTPETMIESAFVWGELGYTYPEFKDLFSDDGDESYFDDGYFDDDTSVDDLLICKDGYASSSKSISKLVGGTDNFGAEGYTYCMFAVKTTAILNYCVIDVTSMTSALSLGGNSTYNPKNFIPADGTSFIMDFIGDIYVARDYIFGFGFAVALLVSFGFMYTIRLPALLTIVVWTCIVLCFLFLLLTGALMYSLYEDWNDASPQTKENYEIQAIRVIAFIFLGAAALWLCMMIFLRSRIDLAIQLTRVGAKAIIDLKTVVLIPILLLAGYLVFLAVWLTYSLLIVTASEETEKYVNGTLVTEFAFSDGNEKTQWYMIFCYYWGSEFISAVGEIIMALCFAAWYFTKDKGDTGMGTVNKAFRMTLRHHLGTAAAGSLIIAIIKTIRAWVAKLKAQAVKHGGKIAAIIFCCIGCCLWCIEKCMKFINRNAYIQCAIYGTSFCASAKAAFFLIARNILRIAMVALVSEIVTFIGTWFIVIVTVALSYMMMQSQLEDELNSLVGPCIFVAFFAYCIANMFMGVFNMGISTLLQCFIADEELHEPGERYATVELSSFIDNNPHPDSKKGEKAEKV